LMGEEVPPVTELVCFVLSFASFGLIIFTCGRLGSTKVHTRSVVFLRRFLFISLWQLN
jgi:hypothetical protein